MVGDYAGYKVLFNAGMTELACWVHVRRRFVEVAKASGSPLAHEAVERIGALYRIEADARTPGLRGEALHAHRNAHATPVLTALHDWLHALSLKTLPGNDLGKAMKHALGRWPALLRYLDNGDRPIDNNPIETERSEGVVSEANVAAKQLSAIRPIILGRKNWLFIGATRAGERAAAIMIVPATASANGLCPHAWLSDALARLPTTFNRDIDQPLPIEGCRSPSNPTPADLERLG